MGTVFDETDDALNVDLDEYGTFDKSGTDPDIPVLAIFLFGNGFGGILLGFIAGRIFVMLPRLRSRDNPIWFWGYELLLAASVEHPVGLGLVNDITGIFRGARTGSPDGRELLLP